MAASDPYPAGLDPAHIVAICAQATGGRRSLAVGALDGICVCLPSRRAARSACAALARVGYTVTSAPGGRGRDLAVSGWSPAGLESRLTAMRAVLHQLADNPAGTAVAVIERFRSVPAGSASPTAGAEILRSARAQLRAWVDARSGAHAPFHPAVLPADVGAGLRLRATWALEQAIDDLAERRLRVAGHALALFSSLRPELGDELAQDRAVRWAGITFHLSKPTALDASPLIQGTVPRTGTAAPAPRRGTSPAIRPVRRLPAAPARDVIREFPVPITTLAAPDSSARLSPARPARQARPADRPRLHP